ncbi:MAG: IS3 family transposase [Maioricimonas sp. JB049]
MASHPRAAQRYVPQPPGDEVRLVQRMRELVQQHPRFGYRRIWGLLRSEGWGVSRKRVHRLWRREGLKIPGKTRKKRARGSSGNACHRQRAEGMNDVCCRDFTYGRTCRIRTGRKARPAAPGRNPKRTGAGR